MCSIAPILCHLTAMLTSAAAQRCYQMSGATAACLISSGRVVSTGNYWALVEHETERGDTMMVHDRMHESALHLVRIRDIAFAILGFQLFLRLVGAAGLDGNGCLTDIGEGGKGSVSLHVASSLSCLGDQVLTESKSVN